MPTTTYTQYYGGSGTDPLIRIEMTAVAGGFNYKITQVQATDTAGLYGVNGGAGLDPNQHFYLGDLRGFFIDFADAESGLTLSNYKTYSNYDASGTGTAVSLVSGTNYKIGANNVTRVGGSDNNMNGALSNGHGYDVGLESGTAGIGHDEIGSLSFTLTGSSLTLDNVLNAKYGIRLTSVREDVNKDGDVNDGCREGTTYSAKINSPIRDSPPPALASLGDFVWHDSNANGIQDSGEAGIAGATVKLLNAAGTTVLATTTTDASGHYAFTNLTPGTYEVQFVQPSGYTQASTADQGGNDALDSDGVGAGLITAPVTLASGDNNTTLDQGFYKPASLGDFVWYDSNANGVQDSGEAGIAGATVKLLNAAGTTVLATTTTDAAGHYAFSNLTPGTYEVQFVQPSGYTQASTADQGGNDALDSDGVGAGLITAPVTLASGDNNTTLDQGFYNLASLGDFVWHDSNANGVQDGGEAGIAGATVKLLNAAGTTVLATTTTDASGHYAFTNLTPGTYEVQFVQPSGYTQASTADQGGNDALDSDGVGAGLITAPVTLASGDNNTTLDQGFYKPASLGDFVWHDSNANGVQDGGEAGIAGATVKLLNAAGTTVLATTTTDASGHYAFTNLTPGTYEVQFVQPSGYTQASTADQGGNDALDSDGVGAGLITAPVTLASGDNNTTLDQGFYNLAPKPSNDTAGVCDGGSVTIDVLANDSDANPYRLTITQINGIAITDGGPAVTLASGAKASLAAGNLVYDVTGADSFDNLLVGHYAQDSFQYTVDNGHGGTGSAQVDIQVGGTVNTVQTIEENLPNSGTLDYKFTAPFQKSPPNPTENIWQLDITNAPTLSGTPNYSLNGTYKDIFCASSTRDIAANDAGTARFDVFQPGYGNVDATVGNEGNANAVAWIINHAPSTFSWIDKQWAIWELLDGPNATGSDGVGGVDDLKIRSNLGANYAPGGLAYEQSFASFFNETVTTLETSADQLVMQARHQQDDLNYVPSSGDNVLFLIEPTTTDTLHSQPLLVQLPFDNFHLSCVC